MRQAETGAHPRAFLREWNDHEESCSDRSGPRARPRRVQQGRREHRRQRDRGREHRSDRRQRRERERDFGRRQRAQRAGHRERRQRRRQHGQRRRQRDQEQVSFGSAEVWKGRPNRRPFFYLRAKWYFGRMKTAALCLLLLLCACKEQRPPAPTTEQTQQLNEAESMLNAAANEEGPEQSPGPSNSSE